MKIDKKYKIEEAASKDKTRFAINAVRIEKTETGALAIATDGRMMAIVPVELEGEDKTAVNLKCEALAVARKEASKNSPCRIELNGAAKISGKHGEQTFPYVDASFPNWAQVIPKAYEKSIKIAFDAKLLLSLWKALGGEAANSNKVIIEVCTSEENRPYLVTTDGDGRGILMPVRIG